MSYNTGKCVVCIDDSMVSHILEDGATYRIADTHQCSCGDLYLQVTNHEGISACGSCGENISGKYIFFTSQRFVPIEDWNMTDAFLADAFKDHELPSQPKIPNNDILKAMATRIVLVIILLLL